MDRPHCNNSNNVHVHGTGAQLYNDCPQMPDKSRCNGITENGCFSFDPGYSSFQPENSEQNHSTCNPKSEQHTGRFQMPGSTPNGTVFVEPYQHVDPMQTPLQNGPIYPQQPLRYSGHSGLMRFSCSGEAVDEYQIPESIPNGPPSTPSLQNGYQSVQNGHINQKSPERCSRQGGPRHFSYSGETVDEYQRTERIPNGPPSIPNSQNSYQSRMQNGPTSPRPPPVIRKHSFLRQNAIEEEDDDNTDELNDSGFGSMCRTTSWEQPRRSRSKDVSDAAADDVNNNLAPRRLQRSQSSQEKTDNELAQYTEKRRCSSEQILQRSNRSSGYFSVDSIQGEVPTGDGSKPDDLAGAEAKAPAGDDDDMTLNICGLRDTLNACKTDRWEVVELHEEISSDPAVQQLLASEVHCRLMRKLSMEAFLHDSQIGQPITSDVASHSTQASVPLDDTVQGLRSTTSRRSDGEEGLSKYIPKSASDILISPPESADDQQGSDDMKNATKQVPEIKLWKAPHHGDTLDQATKDNLQKLLETRAYCEAMERSNCTIRECYMTGIYQKRLEQCCSEGSLDKCSDCMEIVKAYWNHSLGCQSDRCVLPFCSYFKDLHSDNPAMCRFEEACGYLVTKREIEVLEKLHEFELLQHPAADEEIAWSADGNAEIYLREGQRNCHLTTESRLCKFGRFTPICCRVIKPGKARNTVVLKKVRCYQSLTNTLQLLHHKTLPNLKDHISTCLWYRQINNKLLVCSTYLPEKSLLSCLPLPSNTAEEYWIEACKAAVKLHESEILYLNWKVDHLVVTHEGSVKLCNLDYAVDIRPSSSDLVVSLSEEWRGTEVPQHVKTGLDPRIAPPEVLVDGRRLSRESDSWGLGCLLYELCSGGRLPYHDLGHCSDDQIRQKRLSEDYSTHADFSDKIKLLSEMCWKEDQMKRKLPAKLVDCLKRFTSWD